MTTPHSIRKKIGAANLTVLIHGLSNPAFIIAQCITIGKNIFVDMYRHKINESAHRALQTHTVGVWRITYHSKK